jgi:proteasome lid subunit RPN8/RPN11
VRLVFHAETLHGLVRELSHCRLERVFFCVGVRKGEKYIVRACRECPNIAKNPRVEFVADPVCTYKVITEAEERGEEVVSIAHCHPASPRPSLKDLRGMRLWRIPWVIVDSTTGSYAAWIIGVDDKVVEVKVETV